MKRDHAPSFRTGVFLMLAGSLLPAGANAAKPSLLDAVPAGRTIDLASLDWIAPRFSAIPAERGK